MWRTVFLVFLGGVLLFVGARVANASGDLKVLGHWSFDEGSGPTAIDSSANANNGHINNATWVEGVSGQALHFNGTDDSYVEVENKPELSPTDRVVIDAWIKPESYPTWHMAIVYKGDLTQTGCFGERSYSLWARSDGAIHFTWTPKGENCQLNYYTETNLIPSDQWSHVNADLDTEIGKVVISINGLSAFDGDCPRKPIKVGNSPLRIGGMIRSLSDQSNFMGSIDEVEISGSTYVNPNGGLVAYYPFNGNANDESGNGNGGTVYGATLTEDRQAQANGAYHFNGSSDYIAVPDSESLHVMGQITMAAWIFVDSYTSNWWPIICKGYAEDAYRLSVYQGKLAIQMGYTTHGNIDIPQNQWVHVAATWDGNALTFYVNGVPDPASFGFVWNDNSDPLFIGRDPPGSYEYAQGKIDEVRIYNRALSGAEISGFTASVNQPPAPPVASFAFSPKEPNSGDYVTFDASGSKDASGQIVSYEWDFADGETAAGRQVTHRFRGSPNQPKVYQVSLTVRDSQGAAGQTSAEVTVTPLQKKVEVVPDDILQTGLSRIGARALYNWEREENGEDIFQLSEIETWSDYFVGAYVIAVENNSGVLWRKRLPASPLHMTYSPENLYVHASDWLRVTAYGVTEKEMLSIASIMSGLLGGPTMPPGGAPFYYSSDTSYFAPDYVDTSSFPPINVVETQILPLLMGRLCSPGELRVCDPQGRITGLVNGATKEEIPESAFFNGNFIIASPSDNYTYKIVGTDAATYDLVVISVGTERLNGFASMDVPTAPGVVHRYTVDWAALANGQNGVVLEVDTNGDGTIEQTITAGSMLRWPVVVDQYMQTTVGRAALDAKTEQFSVNVTVKNKSSTAIAGPVWLVIDSISSLWVMPANTSGTTVDGKPYIDLSGLLGDGKLDPGETISQRVCFSNPGRVSFTFKPSVRAVISP